MSFTLGTLGATGLLLAELYVLEPSRVFDGESLHSGWRVVVRGERIEAAGPLASTAAPPGAERIALEGATLLPGLIEAHSHVLLHAYDEASWNDQVLKEPRALRVARATNHLRDTLLAGFTTIRDLGTEGAAYDDVGLKQAVEQGILVGPRMLVTTRAIVATGSYGPKGFDPEWNVPLGAEPADGDDLVRVTRDQIGKGADWIKVYADYRWGAKGESRATFSVDELALIVATAQASGRSVVAHAGTAEGMRRAVEAGIETIEHGYGGTPEIFRLMASRGVALCPDPGGDRCHVTLCRLEEGAGARSSADRRDESILSRRSRRGRRRSATEATSASSRTATTPGSSSSWWSTG